MGSRRNGEYVPLDVRYDEDPDIVEASPLAELLFVRCLALAGRTSSDGYLTDAQVVEIAGRRLGPAAKVRKLRDELVDLGPLEKTENGVQVRSWLKWNKSTEDLGRAKAKDRDRKRGARAGVPPDSGPSPGGVHPESERNPSGQPAESGGSPNGFQPRAPLPAPPRVDARAADGTARHYTAPHRTTGNAAAAPSPDVPREAEPPPPRPAPSDLDQARLLALRNTLTEVGLTARWDKLRDDERAETLGLIGVHGVPRLVAEAQCRHRPDDPAAFAQAWIPHWRAMRPPGRLAAVAEPVKPTFVAADPERDRAGVAGARAAIARKAAG